MQQEVDENTSAKKPRVVWSVEMHQQFVNAVNSLGIDSEQITLYPLRAQPLKRVWLVLNCLPPSLPVNRLPCHATALGSLQNAVTEFSTLLIGFAEAVPKRILDQMNVEGLTRENVASHLQVLVHHNNPNAA